MRLLKVKGNGYAVSNPHAANAEPRRFAGYRRKIDLPVKVEGILSFYEPCEEILKDHVALRRAIKKGELDLVAESTDGDTWGLPTRPPPPPPPERNQ